MSDLCKAYESTRNAARRLGVSEAHARRLMKRGVLQGVRSPLGWLIPRDSLNRLAADRKANPPRPGRPPRRRTAKEGASHVHQ